MNILQRLWISVFGPHVYLKQDKAELLLQRGHYGQLLISAQDDCYGIQVRLNGQQAEELGRWLIHTGRSLNPPKKNNLIRFPTKK